MSPGARTEEELIQIVKELRKLIPDVVENDAKFEDDFYLIQWLKRCNFKPERTESMIRGSLAWRKEKDLDSLVNVDKDTFFPVLSQEFQIHIDSVTKVGLPVFSFNGNNVDFLHLFKKHGKEYFLRYIYCCAMKAERIMCEQIKKERAEDPSLQLRDLANTDADGASKMKVGSIAIASFKDVSVWIVKSPIVISLLIEAAKVAMSYFPIFVDQVYFINATKVMSALFKVLKPIIASPYYPVECYGPETSKWPTILSQNVDKSQHMPELGNRQALKC